VPLLVIAFAVAPLVLAGNDALLTDRESRSPPGLPDCRACRAQRWRPAFQPARTPPTAARRRAPPTGDLMARALEQSVVE